MVPCLPALAVLIAASLFAQTDTPPWFVTIAKLASSLSQSDSVGAMETFDAQAANYGVIESNIEALVAQTDVLCAIDPVDEKESDGVHDIDADWYMQLKSQTTGGPVERRRERIHIRLKQISGKWKIISISPVEILSPIHVQ